MILILSRNQPEIIDFLRQIRQNLPKTVCPLTNPHRSLIYEDDCRFSHALLTNSCAHFNLYKL